MAGRPSKLTPELQQRIVDVVRGGCFREVAAKAAGIAPETLSRWLAQDRAPYVEFRQALLRAESAAENEREHLLLVDTDALESRSTCSSTPAEIAEQHRLLLARVEAQRVKRIYGVLSAEGALELAELEKQL